MAFPASRPTLPGSRPVRGVCNMLKNKKVWFGILTIVPIILVLVLHATGALARVENRITDFRYIYFNPGHEFSEDIILLEID